MSEIKNVTPAKGEASGLSRRQFVGGIGALGALGVIGGAVAQVFLLPDEVMAYPVSGGFLLVDQKKCSGCSSCMAACALAHHGAANHSLARIQITQNPFKAFPHDIDPVQCWQCDECVSACPTGAMHVDADTGVRTVDRLRCIGCLQCVAACPRAVSAVQWNEEKEVSQKCDLCLDTPFMNDEGGIDGRRACESVCPMRAIKFTPELPDQTEAGYSPNLRTENWASFGYVADIEG
ncbi:MAG: 4Fe-4S dicluster domain-containing protein [Coriobacteriia bacterium]